VTGRASPLDKAAHLISRHVLTRLPGRIARFGWRALRGREIAALRRGPSPTLLVTHDLSRSGAPRLMLEMALMLRGDGHEVALLSPFPGPILTDVLDAGIHVIIDRDLASSSWLPDLAKRARLVVCNTVETRDVVRRVSPLAPVLWYLHEVSLLEERLKEAATLDAIAATGVLWAGSALCGDIVRPVRSDVGIVPYGIEAPPFAPPPGGERFTVAVLGSIESRKGQDLAVAAMTMLPPSIRDRIQLQLFGRVLEPVFAHEVMTQVDGVAVRYGGELDKAGVTSAMQSADAILVPSRDDTLPLVSLDTLGLGRMLLLAPTVGTTAWVTDGLDALIAPSTDARGIAELLGRAFALWEGGEAPAMGAAARATFTKHFSIPAYRSKLNEALATLSSRR
jgi:glycosyltransferase involved in cell wall biosynthesis